MSQEINKELKLKEIKNNYETFQKVLPQIIDCHRGTFALMKDGEIIDYYSTAIDAERAGYGAYKNGMFSVQKVDDSLINLGVFTDA